MYVRYVLLRHFYRSSTTASTRTKRKRDQAEAGLVDEDKKPSPREDKLARSSADTDKRKDPQEGNPPAAGDMGNALESAAASRSTFLVSAISSPSTSFRHEQKAPKKSKTKHPQCPICQEGMRPDAALTVSSP